MYYSAKVPCIGFIGIIFGGALILFGLRMLGLDLGIVKPEDLPQPQQPKRNPAMVCPHCQAKGSVTTEKVKLKKGVSARRPRRRFLPARYRCSQQGFPARKTEL